MEAQDNFTMIPNIGSATQQGLRENGVTTFLALSRIADEDLLAYKGVDSSEVPQIKSDARTLALVNGQFVR